MGFLFGTFRHQIDEKGRVRIPSKIRTNLGEGFVIIKGETNCLFLLPATQFEKLYQKVEGISLADDEAQRANREIFSNSSVPEEDNQGRMSLDKEQIAFAGISKNIVTIGVGSRAEIWSEEYYELYKAGKLQAKLDADKQAQAAVSLSIVSNAVDTDKQSSGNGTNEQKSAADTQKEETLNQNPFKVLAKFGV